MAMLAHHLVESGVARNVLVVAGENRLTGQSRDCRGADAGAGRPAGVRGAARRRPFRPTTGWWPRATCTSTAPRRRTWRELAVLMRRHACMHPGAQFQEPITCRDGAGVEADRRAAQAARLLPGLRRRRGVRGEPRPHQRLPRAHHRHGPGAYASARQRGAEPDAVRRGVFGCEGAGGRRRRARRTSTTPRSTTASPSRSRSCSRRSAWPRAAQAGRLARDGHFNHDGKLPLNTHGGLLSYGHCGVRRCHGAPGGDPSADDRPGRAAPGEECPPGAAARRRRCAVLPCEPGAREGGDERTAIRDWTHGGEGIAYQACAACEAVWYFQRSVLPALRRRAIPMTRQASGTGTVHARTLVTRAPTEELRAHAPYADRAGRRRRRLPPDGARRSGRCASATGCACASSIWPAG